MSNLKKLIKESKIAKRELVASTVRIPKEKQSFIDDLAEHLSLTKQETMLMLIEEGISVAENELKLNDGICENENSSFHILNTNKRHDVTDSENMIKNGIAKAFYKPWKFNIDRIKENDTIFLYENGVGIVGYGRGTGKRLKKAHHGNIDECYYQELKDYKILEKPIHAREIKKILNRNVVFLRTMSGMPDGEKILNTINKI